MLLHRYSSQQDIVVGTPIANRHKMEIEGLIGFFVNTLALRTDCSDNPTFLQLLAQVREKALGAYAHQDLPFEKLVEELQPERNLSYNPIFQVMFILQNTAGKPLNLPGITTERLSLKGETEKFDLTLALTEIDDGLKAELTYNTNLFEAATIERLITHYGILLEDIVADPHKRIGQLRLLTQSEQRQLVEVWNSTKSKYDVDKGIGQLFEAQADRTPQAIALIFGEQRLTYRQLNTQANQLAHYLTKQGVGPGVFVGVCMSRSLEMVVSLLAVLKTGGAYVPLDPAYPPERLAFMVQDAQIAVLLTQPGLQKITLPCNGKTIVMDTATLSLINQEKTQNPTNQNSSSDPAYVIYTSGSTGTPKGVVGLHQGAVNRFAWMWETYPFSNDEICCQKTSLNFVDSVWEIFGPLLRGVPTVILPDEIVKDPRYLVEALAANKVTRLVLVPSLLQALLDTLPNLQSQLPSLKLWVTSGEALSLDLYRRFRDAMPHSILLNLYGSSEVSADVTYFDTTSMKDSYAGVPIGRPIANTQIYLLDSYLNPVPVGVPGELYAGGDGLAHGYFNRPDLTAERFISNPFRANPQSRLYKTGDLARYLPDGNIEYLGRTDYQVKIRGFRIELGEIETALEQHPHVQQAVVLASQDTQRLAAYVVISQELTPDALHTFLKEKLPAYMLPAAFVILDELPLTPNGKINRRALPEPNPTRAVTGKIFATPQNDIERQLARIWENLLGIQPIGRNDDFFALGGHSLLAVNLFIQIEKTLGVNLPLATLFKQATVKHLADVIGQQTGSKTWAPLVKIQPEGSQPPFFCVHGITGDILWFKDLARCLAPHQPFYGLQSVGLDGIQSPLVSVEAMAAYYVKEMRKVQRRGPYYLGGASFGGAVALEITQQLQAQGECVGLLAIFDHALPNLNLSMANDVTIWSPEFAINVLRNFPRWLGSFIQLAPGQMGARLRRKTRVASKKIRNNNDLPIEVADIIDYAAGLPEPRRKLIEANYRAIKNYRPQPFNGPVFLFRAQVRSLLNPRDPALGWQHLTGGQTTVIDVPGSHEGMFHEPHAHILAKQLKSALYQVQSTQVRTNSTNVRSGIPVPPLVK